MAMWQTKLVLTPWLAYAISMVYLFYVAAPLSSIDLSTSVGEQIPIEERPAEELIYFQAKLLAPREINVYNPAFDVTPQKFISALITEKGIIHKPLKKNLRKITP